MSADEIGRGAGNFFRATAGTSNVTGSAINSIGLEIKFLIYTTNGNDARYVKHFQRCELLHRMFQAEYW
jgi:hypothetical protein